MSKMSEQWLLFGLAGALVGAATIIMGLAFATFSAPSDHTFAKICAIGVVIFGAGSLIVTITVFVNACKKHLRR